MTTLPDLTTHSGWRVPAVGLGTYTLNGGPGSAAVRLGVENGYRLIDSAFNYENEGAVGAGVRSSDADRSTLIVTSKLPGRHHHKDEAIATIEESVMRTGLDYLDLYLIHWPNPLEGLYVEAWEALLEAKERGLIKHAGVSNFLPEHIDRLIAETGETPEVNQIELHPYFQQHEQLAYNTEHGIVTEAWSPLGRGNDMTENPLLQSIADKHGITVHQVVLRWHTIIGAVPLPKSSNAERQRANLNLADIALDDDDLAAIASLDRPDGRLENQDPAVYQEF